MGAETTSAVTIVLDLQGQRAAVAGLTQVTDAVASLSAAVKDADAAVVSSTAAMATSTTGAYQDVADEATAATVRVTDANETVVKSNADLAASAAATADAVSTSYAKMGTAATTLGTRSTAAMGSGGKGTGILGLLTSMRTLVTGAVAYESVKFFDTYQTALVKLGTQAGLTSAQLSQVSAQIMRQSVTLRTTPAALAGAYYNPISEGWSPAQASNIVARAAQLANMSGSDLTGQEGTSYTLSTMLRNYGMAPTPTNVLKMAALLRGATSTGDLTLSQLLAANSTGYFNATQAYGINPTAAMGNLAFFSSQGVNPQTAATRMRMTMALLAAPNEQSTKYLTQMGLTTTEVTGLQGQLAALGLTTTKMASLLRTPNGINAAVAEVVKAASSLTPDMREALYSKIFGGGRSEATFLTLAQHPELANFMYQRVGQMSTTGSYNNAVATYNATFAGTAKEAEAAASKLAVSVGSVLKDAFAGMLKVASPVLSFLADFKPAATALGLLVGGMMVASIVELTTRIATLITRTNVWKFATESAWRESLVAEARSVYESATLAAMYAAEWVSSTTAVAAGWAADAAAATAAFVAENAATLGIAGLVALLVTGVVLLATHWKQAWHDITVASNDFAHFFEHLGEDIWHPIDAAIHAFEDAWKSTWTSIKSVTTDAIHDLMVIFWPLTDMLHGVIAALHWFGVAKGINVPLINPFSAKTWESVKLASGGRVGGGFQTNGPMAIVGEGRSQFPEFVIPTDPQYRGRALGLLGQLAPRLMLASGGTVGGYGLSAVGSGMGLLEILRQLITGDPTGSLRGVLGSFGGTNANAIPNAMRSVEDAIATAVPGGLFRSLMLAVVSTMFGAVTRSVSGGGTTASVASKSSNVALGQQLAAAMGWTGQEWSALDQLWNKESGWSNTALNPASGAYGIAQALPPTKMPYAAQAAGGSSARAQIDWGLSYIRQRYGDPVAAWAHEMAQGWYARGGVLPVASYDTGGFLPQGLSLAVNGTGGPEQVLGPGGGGDLHVHLELDGKEVCQATISNFRQRVARR